MRRSVASCYSDHAVKVSDSYCSGPSVSHRRHLNPEKQPVSTADSVASVYRLNSSQPLKTFFISLTWLNTPMGRGFLVNVGRNKSFLSQFNCNLKEILKGKGSKQFQFQSSKIELQWDLSSARYDPGPDPSSGFRISLMVDSELSLLIGDKDDDLETEISPPKFSLISRSERYCSLNAVYSTRAKFTGAGKTHEITVKCTGEDQNSKRPVLYVFIDKKKIFQVNRLRWNFRGNQTMFLDGLVVDMMWDVRCWFFSSPAGSAIFMFRTRSGMDSRLWLEEEKKMEKTEEEEEEEEEEAEDRAGFCLLICACNYPD